MILWILFLHIPHIGSLGCGELWPLLILKPTICCPISKNFPIFFLKFALFLFFDLQNSSLHHSISKKQLFWSETEWCRNESTLYVIGKNKKIQKPMKNIAGSCYMIKTRGLITVILQFIPYRYRIISKRLSQRTYIKQVKQIKDVE